jgi:hypothetical protein
MNSSLLLVIFCSSPRSDHVDTISSMYVYDVKKHTWQPSHSALSHLALSHLALSHLASRLWMRTT